jgi:hypothetical protein
MVAARPGSLMGWWRRRCCATPEPGGWPAAGRSHVVTTRALELSGHDVGGVLPLGLRPRSRLDGLCSAPLGIGGPRAAQPCASEVEH